MAFFKIFTLYKVDIRSSDAAVKTGFYRLGGIKGKNSSLFIIIFLRYIQVCKVHRPENFLIVFSLFSIQTKELCWNYLKN